MPTQRESRAGLSSRQLAHRPTEAFLAWQNSLRHYPKSKPSTTIYIQRMEKLLKDALGRHFDSIATLPEDFLQHGESIVVEDYQDLTCVGVAPFLRRKAVDIIASLVCSNKFEGGNEVFKAHLLNQINQELDKWQSYANQSVGKANHANDCENLFFYNELYQTVNNIDLSASQANRKLAQYYRTYMSKDGIYATPIEGEILAKYFGMCLFINGHQQTITGANRPYRISLTHTGEGVLGHYTIFGATVGNGDCLCNAFAQKIGDLWVKRKLKISTGRQAAQAAYRQTMQVHLETTPKIVQSPPATSFSTELSSKFLQQLLCQAGMNKMLECLLSPHAAETLSAPDAQKILLQQSMALLQNETLNQKLKNLVGETATNSFTQPQHTHDESKEIQTAVVRAAIATRPAYFEETKSSIDISFKFFKEFVGQGAMSNWEKLLTERIKESGNANTQQQTDFLKLMDGIVWLFNEIAAERNPLDIYIDNDEFVECQKLDQWLTQNETSHDDYQNNYARFKALDEKILAARENTLQKLDDWIMNLTSSLTPEATDHLLQKQRLIEEKRKQFSQYLCGSITEKDWLETSKLRAIYEMIYRGQYGALFYQFVCESNQDEFINSKAHKIAQTLWLLNILDTIHISPQEARSRMPNVSFDGRIHAPNFGYQMPESAAYQEWLTQPFARACGDIIMDAFPAVIDFGREINIDTFIERLINEIDNTEENKKITIERNDEYEQYTISLMFFLLETGFQIKFKRNVVDELRKAAGNQITLTTKAREALNQFKQLCQNFFALRPGNTEVTGVSPLVFGIGFNGNLFNCPSHTNDNQNEIYLTFSKSARNLGSELFLHFLKAFAQHSNNRVTNYLDLKERNTPLYYKKYKTLIKYHINIQLAYFSKYSQLDPRLRDFQNRQLQKFNNFLSEVNSGKSFSELQAPFQKWVTDASNWYCLPSQNQMLHPKFQAHVRTAPPMSETEEHVQHLTREFIFDLCCGRSLTKSYPNLIPWLFEHWRKELLQRTEDSSQLTLNKKIADVDQFNQLSSDEQRVITSLLDEHAKRIHQTIIDVWNPEITQKFTEFKKIKENEQKRKHLGMTQKKKQLTRKITQLESFLYPSIPPPEEQKYFKNIQNLQEQITNLETKLATPSSPLLLENLSEELYQTFKQRFFKGRNVVQCIEPSFSRVLGHDHFYSVFISKDMGRTVIQDPLSDNVPPQQLKLGHKIPQSVIPPCDNRCQYHATAHLLVGDMLADQSANRLNDRRNTHGFSAMPFRLFPNDQHRQKTPQSDTTVTDECREMTSNIVFK